MAKQLATYRTVQKPGSTSALDDFVARQVIWVCQAVELVQRRGLNLPRGVELKAQKECPDCGMPMRKRTSKHGSFWGCTGYPGCMATVQIGGKRRRKKAEEE